MYKSTTGLQIMPSDSKAAVMFWSLFPRVLLNVIFAFVLGSRLCEGMSTWSSFDSPHCWVHSTHMEVPHTECFKRASRHSTNSTRILKGLTHMNHGQAGKQSFYPLNRYFCKGIPSF